MATELIEVIFKGKRVDIFANPNKLNIRRQMHVIVEADRGIDIGQVGRTGSVAFLTEDEQLKNVIRIATEEDLKKMQENRSLEKEALETCKQKVDARHLNMNMIDAEWQLDHNRITFYFTSENRVDFRELVRELASIFKTRIELRQIGVRDAARRIGGCGVCGRELCCSIFLKECESISLQFAKDQLLPTNPSRLTGICGRLKCCLSYERDFYLEELEHYPAIESLVTTPQGVGVVEKVDIFQQVVVVRLKNNDVEAFPIGEINSSESDYLKEVN